MKKNSKLTAEIVIMTVCGYYKIDPQRLKGPEKTSLITEPRKICAFLHLLYDGVSNDIASDLGYKLDQSVYHARWRLLIKMKKEETKAKRTRLRNTVLYLSAVVYRALNQPKNAPTLPLFESSSRGVVVNIIEVQRVVSKGSPFDQLINAVWLVCCPACSLASFSVSEQVFYARQLSIFLTWSWLKHDMEIMMEEFNADQEYIQRAIGIVEYNLNNGQIHNEESLIKKIEQKLFV